MIDALSFFATLKSRLHTAGEPDRALKMSVYMRDQFEFFGVIAPLRKTILKACITECGLPPIAEWPHLAELCFALGEARELAYAFGDITIPEKKKIPTDWLPLLEALIVDSAWWDTVDWLAPHLAAMAMTKTPEQIPSLTGRWIRSDNIWLQRSAIIFQLHAKAKTDESLLYEYILYRADSKEFFVQKGAGWALRQYSKTNPQSVAAFIDKEENKLAPLTIREGRKILLKRDS